MISTDSYSYHPYYKDVLTSFNKQSITYDSLFNPVQIGNNTLSWTRGRLLNSITINNVSTSFSYDYKGYRISKYNSSTGYHIYYYFNNKLLFEKVTNGSNTDFLQFFYGQNGIYALRVNNRIFHLEKNPLGDVIAIYYNNTRLCRYIYDAYGNHTIIDESNNIITDPTNIGLINPIRYRGYYYDQETNLYYCLSRYYNPVWRRWLNLDDLSYLNNTNINGINLFSYCHNNPIMYVDETGHFSVLAGIMIGVGFLAATGLGLTIGGRLSSNETIVNIGDSIISFSEIVAGISLVATGFGGRLGMCLIGSGIGSVANGLLTLSHNGSYHAGWIGGQIAGAFTYLVPNLGLGIPLGTFLGSLTTDFIDNGYTGVSKEQFLKASWSAVISYGLSCFGTIASDAFGNSLFTIDNAFLQYLLSYESALIGVCNSIVDVFWPKKRKI